MKEFTGDIYQSHLNELLFDGLRELELCILLTSWSNMSEIITLRILCQAGTYVRKIIYDLGEVLSLGATMIELRRTGVTAYQRGQKAL